MCTVRPGALSFTAELCDGFMILCGRRAFPDSFPSRACLPLHDVCPSAGLLVDIELLEPSENPFAVHQVRVQARGHQHRTEPCPCCPKLHSVWPCLGSFPTGCLSSPRPRTQMVREAIGRLADIEEVGKMCEQVSLPWLGVVARKRRGPVEQGGGVMACWVAWEGDWEVLRRDVSCRGAKRYGRCVVY